MKLDRFVKEVDFKKPKGTYYLHVLIVDNFGCSNEILSSEVTIKNSKPLYFGFTSRVESVSLDAGRYKLEVWGAQGGSFTDEVHGGYGGYSTGTKI